MKECYICGKSAVSGNNVSHSQRKTKRRFSPNLHSAEIKTKKYLICSRCQKKMQYLKVT